jgi:hypothetical protein
MPAFPEAGFYLKGRGNGAKIKRDQINGKS